MGYLSQTVKKEEGAFESFYGTNIAGSTVAASEMNEQEVCNCFYHVDLPFEPRPPSQMPASNAYRYIKDERECSGFSSDGATNDQPYSPHGWYSRA